MSQTAALLQAANLLRSMPNEQKVSNMSTVNGAPHSSEESIRDPVLIAQAVEEAATRAEAVNIITNTTPPSNGLGINAFTNGKKDKVPELKPRPASLDDGIDMLQRAAGREVLPQPHTPIKQSQSLDSGVNLLSCPDCDKTFGQKSALDKHVQMKHTRPFHCRAPGCRRTVGFGTRNDLQRHEFTKHPNLWPSSSIQCIEPGCQSADKRWSRLDNFRAHLRRIHKLEDLSKYDIGKMVRRPIARKPSKDVKSSHDSSNVDDKDEDGKPSLEDEDEKMSDAEGAEYGDELVTSPTTSFAETAAAALVDPEDISGDAQGRRLSAVMVLTEKIMSVIRSAGETPTKEAITNSPPVNEFSSLRGLSQSTSSMRFTIDTIPDESQVAIAIPKSAVEGMKTRLHDMLAEYLSTNRQLAGNEKTHKCTECDKNVVSSQTSELK